MNRMADLRAYVAALDMLGELQRVHRDVDLELELGAIVRRSYELRAPAPLFARMIGAAEGFRVLGAPAGVSGQPGLLLARVALSLGLEPAAHGREIVEAMAAALTRPGVPPRRVATAAFQQNVRTGDDVDLTTLPAPLIHGGDGGRYLNTFGLNVVRTPDRRWTNWSINRMMIHDRNHLTGTLSFNQHIGMIHSEWRARDEPMPIAIALGVEPALPFLAGGMPLPDEISESDYAGAYFDEPVDVTHCHTVDLDVPASAEIVVEGLVSPDEKGTEGPMAEYPGYQQPGASTPKPLITVTAITHRDNAILPVVAAGPPVEEDHTAWGIPHAAQCLHDLRQHRLPVAACWLPLESANHWLVVSLRTDWRTLDRFAHHTTRQMCARIGRILFETKSGMDIPTVIVVEDDIDITDTAQVVWAFATRCHPGAGTIQIGEEEMMVLPVFLDGQDKHRNYTVKSVHNCLYHDGTTVETAPVPATFARGWPAHVTRRVTESWTSYGYQKQT